MGFYRPNGGREVTLTCMKHVSGESTKADAKYYDFSII